MRTAATKDWRIFGIMTLLIVALYTISAHQEKYSSPLYTAECCSARIPADENQQNMDDIVALQRISYNDRTSSIATFTYDEKFKRNLSKIITAEASICDDWHQQLVWYVVVNRVLSSAYPNTLEEVFYDSDEYAETSRESYEKDIISDCALKNAEIVCENFFNGTVPVPANLVYQSEFVQGEIFYQGENTYFGIRPDLPDKY